MCQERGATWKELTLDVKTSHEKKGIMSDMIVGSTVTTDLHFATNASPLYQHMGKLVLFLLKGLLNHSFPQNVLIPMISFDDSTCLVGYGGCEPSPLVIIQRGLALDFESYPHSYDHVT